MKIKDIVNIIGDADFDIVGDAIVFHGRNLEAKHTIDEVCNLYRNLGATISRCCYSGKPIHKSFLNYIKLALGDNKEVSWVNSVLNMENAAIILKGAEFTYATDIIPAGAVVHVPHTDISRIYSKAMPVELLLDVRLSPEAIDAAADILIRRLGL